MPPDSSSRVLVTGASTGIGRATVLALAKRGAQVYAGVRRSADADSLTREGGPNVRPLLLDVTVPDAIDAARDILSSSGAPLTGLVNNAGFALAGPLELVAPAELRRQFDVNFFGALALTQALLPQLRAARGRIVNVSSIGGKFAAPFVGAYAASKFALEAASDALRLELRPFGVAVILIEPGAVRTPIWQRGAAAGRALIDGGPSTPTGSRACCASRGGWKRVAIRPRASPPRSSARSSRAGRGRVISWVSMRASGSRSRGCPSPYATGSSPQLRASSCSSSSFRSWASRSSTSWDLAS
jgi:NAD(P)-dependent dehydrogenase (short-subunit alcohol dehydrogenase family)